MKKIAVFIILSAYLLLAFPLAILMGAWESADELNDRIKGWIHK
jgi:hypothetical protein